MGQGGLQGGNTAEKRMNERVSLMLIELPRRRMVVAVVSTTVLVILEKGMKWGWGLQGFEWGLMGVKRGRGLGLEEELGGEGLEEVIRCGERRWRRRVVGRAAGAVTATRTAATALICWAVVVVVVAEVVRGRHWAEIDGEEGDLRWLLPMRKWTR
ncbi:hypothetical protein OPV22_007622 [Ensete ventricosum]|uniref:Uncharacterized protein n=1 Tax=Ensete ventricosum TaxID=4639 RepID=A0AAV8RN89_ENSVE|nr:hypothetical protein OPV22_007622 [Ensete ventricosum]